MKTKQKEINYIMKFLKVGSNSFIEKKIQSNFYYKTNKMNNFDETKKDLIKTRYFKI